jgi:hypothetical protein
MGQQIFPSKPISRSTSRVIFCRGLTPPILRGLPRFGAGPRQADDDREGTREPQSCFAGDASFHRKRGPILEGHRVFFPGVSGRGTSVGCATRAGTQCEDHEPQPLRCRERERLVADSGSQAFRDHRGRVRNP